MIILLCYFNSKKTCYLFVVFKGKFKKCIGLHSFKTRSAINLFFFISRKINIFNYHLTSSFQYNPHAQYKNDIILLPIYF